MLFLVCLTLLLMYIPQYSRVIGFEMRYNGRYAGFDGLTSLHSIYGTMGSPIGRIHFNLEIVKMRQVTTELQKTVNKLDKSGNVVMSNGKAEKERVHDRFSVWYCPDLSDFGYDMPEPDKWEATDIVGPDGAKVSCEVPVYDDALTDWLMKAIRDKALSISRSREKSDTQEVPETMADYLASAGGMPISQQSKIFAESYREWMAANGYDAQQIATYGTRYVKFDTVAALEGAKLEHIVSNLNKFIPTIDEEMTGKLAGVLRKYQDAITIAAAASEADAF